MREVSQAQRTELEAVSYRLKALETTATASATVASDVSSLKSLMLSKRQFPAAPTPTIPSWQRQMPAEDAPPRPRASVTASPVASPTAVTLGPEPAAGAQRPPPANPAPAANAATTTYAAAVAQVTPAANTAALSEGADSEPVEVDPLPADSTAGTEAANVARPQDGASRAVPEVPTSPAEPEVPAPARELEQ